MSSTNQTSETPRGTLTGRTFAGLGWSYLAAGGSAIVQIAYVAAMSRLLDPRAFGLMAIANIAVSFGFYFARMGVAQALIQRATITQNEVRAAVTSGWLTGGACAVILWLGAPQVAAVFSEPDAIPLLRVMAVSFLFSGLTMTSQGLLRRSMRFRELSIIQMACALSGAVVGLASAIVGAGVWSLVYAALTSTLLQFLLQYWRVRHPLRPLLRFREFKELYSFGVKISVIRLGEFAGKNLDTLAVGRIASTASLGLYNRAFYLVNLPVSQYLSNALSTVLFPGFSRVQTDPERVRRVYLSVIRLAAVILFPVCAGMAVAGREIVLVALGGQWVDAIPLVPFFAAAAALNIISKLSELVAEARAHLNSVILLQFSYLGVLAGLLAVVALTDGEIWMFAAALAAGEVVRQAMYLILMRRITGVSVRQSLSAFLPAVFVAVVVVAATGSVRYGLLSVLESMPLLMVEVVAGGIGVMLGIRFSPSPAVRRDLGGRLRAARVTGPNHPVLTRLGGLMLGSYVQPRATQEGGGT